jgi:Raf kinase inhibitor-like YbhB/YbcL family protein
VPERGSRPHDVRRRQLHRQPLGDNPLLGQGDPGDTLPLRSTDFDDHAPLSARQAKDGGNQPPELEWSNVPERTHELVVLCVDPDATRGSFLHWLVTGIPPGATGLASPGPTGTLHRNGFGVRGYSGPHPPVGDPAHRYIFRIYALDEPFAGPAEARDADAICSWLDRHALATGTIIGLYRRRPGLHPH